MTKLYPLLVALAACSGPGAPADQSLARPPAPLKAAAGQAGTPPDTVRFADTLWLGNYAFDRPGYRVPDTIAGKPVAFYLANPRLSPLAKALYAGHFRPVDDESTTQLLALVVTDDAQLRPFYRWCLEFTIAVADGALGEYPGPPALRYAVDFPQEFLLYWATLSAKQRENWLDAIAYSGLPNLSDYPENLAAAQRQLSVRMQKNCPGCPAATRQAIEAFVQDLIEKGRRQES